MGGCTSDNRSLEENLSSKSNTSIFIEFYELTKSNMKLADIRSRQVEFDSHVGSSLVSKGFQDEISEFFATIHPFTVRIGDQPHIEEANRIRNQFLLKHGGLQRQSQFDIKFSQVLPTQEWFTNEKGSNLFWGSLLKIKKFIMNNKLDVCLLRGLPHGWGELYTSKGITIIGYFEEGTPNYHAKIKYSNDSVYVGGIYRQMKDGFGSLTKRNGEVQEGHWRFNLLNGFASIKDPSGKVIASGDFVNGRLANQFSQFRFRTIECLNLYVLRDPDHLAYR